MLQRGFVTFLRWMKVAASFSYDDALGAVVADDLPNSPTTSVDRKLDTLCELFSFIDLRHHRDRREEGFRIADKFRPGAPSRWSIHRFVLIYLEAPSKLRF
jgi:hypothetical protein